MSKRTRGSSARQPAALPAAPAVDSEQLNSDMELLLTVTARQLGVTTAGVDMTEIREQLRSTVAVDQAVEAEGGRSRRLRHQEQAADDEEEAEGDDARATRSTARATDSTKKVLEKLVELEKTGMRSSCSYGYAGNPSSQCGVCAATWDENCDWEWSEHGKGNWACFTHQVYICGWGCLNMHNQEGLGNKAGAWIMTKEEAKEAKEEKRKQ